MNSRSFKVFHFCALALFLITACQEPTGPSKGSIEIACLGPTTVLESGAKFKAINNSEEVFWYYGYEDTLPIYTREIESDTGWVEDMVGWCGVGLTKYEFEPQRYFEFEAHGPIEEHGAWRVGIWFYFDEDSQDHEIFWSEKVLP
ncbi:MAG: hypothetical protein JSU77_05750 [Fidelibacterota bacterium]|nr:MAG: hypothetical protein JSU77_05750 [Candidatus Neomarinimicrobiota bacterium]